jgi:hypothetical protein
MNGFLVEVFVAIVAGLLVELIMLIVHQRPPLKTLLEDGLKNWKRVLLYAAFLLLLCIVSDFTPVRLGETVRVWCLGLPPQERMVSDAWESYNRGDFQGAIDRSRTVVTLYEPSAQSDQHVLDNAKVEQWDTGKVRFGKIWKSMDVFDRGSLNSVAVAWWIEGQSQQRLGHLCDAKIAFEAAAKYSYARTWDPQSWPIRGWSPFGWFWSPPDDAQQRADSITCQTTSN